MKKILFLLVPVFLIAITELFISCDYLIPAPLGRDNPYDDEAQIGRFAAAASGPDSVVTVWDWRDPPSGIDKSRIIDKIRIVYGENSQPLSKYPINPDNVIEFTSNSDFFYEWKNLNEDEDHNFALYAHEKGGMWLAPKRSDIYIDNGSEQRLNIGYTGLYVNTSLPANPVFWPTAVELVHELPELTIFFLVFDTLYDHHYGIVNDARITNFVFGNVGTVDIVPMRIRVDDTMDWDDISNPIYYDYEKANKNVYISAGNDEIQIKDQINISRLYGSNTVAVIPNTGSPIDMTVDTVDFNNGGEDLFSVWWSND